MATTSSPHSPLLPLRLSSDTCFLTLHSRTLGTVVIPARFTQSFQWYSVAIDTVHVGNINLLNNGESNTRVLWLC